VNRVVLQVVDEVTRPDIGFYPEFVLFEVWIARQGRWFPLAKVYEDESQIFHCRATSYVNFFREGLFLRGLLNALPRFAEFPAMETASNTIILDPADGEQCLAVGTARPYHVGLAPFSTIKGELFVHDFDRLGPARLHVLRPMNGMPKLPHVPAGQSLRPGIIKIHEVDHRNLLLDSVLYNFIIGLLLFLLTIAHLRTPRYRHWGFSFLN
jgi:hypothetical protein